jgi:hypothetical protein
VFNSAHFVRQCTLCSTVHIFSTVHIVFNGAHFVRQCTLCSTVYIVFDSAHCVEHCILCSTVHIVFNSAHCVRQCTLNSSHYSVPFYVSFLKHKLQRSCPVDAVKACGGVAVGGATGQLHALATSLLGKIPQFSLTRRLDGPFRTFWRAIPCICQESNRDFSNARDVAGSLH